MPVQNGSAEFDGSGSLTSTANHAVAAREVLSGVGSFAANVTSQISTTNVVATNGTIVSATPTTNVSFQFNCAGGNTLLVYFFGYWAGLNITYNGVPVSNQIAQVQFETSISGFGTTVLTLENPGQGNFTLSASWSTSGMYAVIPVALNNAGSFTSIQTTASNTTTNPINQTVSSKTGALVLSYLFQEGNNSAPTTTGTTFRTYQSGLSAVAIVAYYPGASSVSTQCGAYSGYYTQMISLSVNPTTVWQDTAAFTGTGSLSATADLGLLALGVFSGAGSLAAVAVVGAAASASYAGAGSLAYLGSLGLIASATLSDNSSSLVAYGSINTHIAVAFGGTGLVNASAIDIPPGGLVAVFNGSGGLTSTILLHLSSGLIPFAGAGSLLPTVFLIEQASAIFGGTGSMRLPLSGGTTYSGAGSLSVATIWNPRIGFFAGDGLLSANSYRVISVVNQFSGTGRVCVQATVRLGRGGPVSNQIVTGPGASFNITVGGG